MARASDQTSAGTKAAGGPATPTAPAWVMTVEVDKKNLTEGQAARLANLLAVQVSAALMANRKRADAYAIGTNIDAGVLQRVEKAARKGDRPWIRHKYKVSDLKGKRQR